MQKPSRNLSLTALQQSEPREQQITKMTTMTTLTTMTTMTTITTMTTKTAIFIQIQIEIDLVTQ